LVGVALIARLCSPALAAAASPQEWPDTFGFAQAQVEAGRSSNAKFCSSCHGDKLDGAGAPALTGEAFLTRWASGTRPARDLYDAVSRMPKLAPESLSKSQYLDITSYILATNGFAPSSTPASETTLQKLLKGSSLPKENSPLVEHGEFPRPPSSVAQASQKSPTTADLAAPSDDDWLMYNRDYTGQRYSGLAEINVRNAAQLQPICMLQLGVLSAFQSSPLIYRGVGYVTTTRMVNAFDAATCKRLWTYNYEMKGHENIPTNRGLAIYDGKLFRGTTDGHLLALDAANGHEVVAAIRNDLQPRLQVPAERPNHPIQVVGGRSRPIVKPSKPVAAKQIKQRHQASAAGVGSLPAFPRSYSPNRRRRLSRWGLRLRSRSYLGRSRLRCNLRGGFRGTRRRRCCFGRGRLGRLRLLRRGRSGRNVRYWRFGNTRGRCGRLRGYSLSRSDLRGHRRRGRDLSLS